MKITQIRDGKNLTLKLEGWLDTVTSPELKTALDGVLDGIDSLTLDFADLEYISSAGLRVLLTAHTAMARKGGMKLLHLNEEIKDTFAVTGMAPFLHIAED